MKKLIIVSLIIILGVLILWFQNRNGGFILPAVTPTPTFTSTLSPSLSMGPTVSLSPINQMQNAEVTFAGGSGYSPATLKIKKGVVVVFKNQGSGSIWPASGTHPAHNVYPIKGGCIDSAFDACTAIKSGESWTFEFDVVGTWKYHDHLNPAFTGTIIVEE